MFNYFAEGCISSDIETEPGPPTIVGETASFLAMYKSRCKETFIFSRCRLPAIACLIPIKQMG